MKKETFKKWVKKCPALEKVLTEKLTHQLNIDKVCKLVNNFGVEIMGKEMQKHVLRSEVYTLSRTKRSEEESYKQERAFLIWNENEIEESRFVKSSNSDNFSGLLHEDFDYMEVDRWKPIGTHFQNGFPMYVIYVQETGYSFYEENVSSSHGWVINAIKVKIYFFKK